MNQFNIKRTNIVGLCAAVLAFIFSFLPFYKAELGDFTKSYASSHSTSSESINLIKYNFFGTLLFILVLALIILFLVEASGKANAMLSSIITALTLLSLVLLLLTIVVGNKDVKEAKDLMDQSSPYMSLLGMDSSDLMEFKVGIGYILEIIAVLVLTASYWINEFLIKTMVYHFQFRPEVNPFKALITSKPSYGAANGQYNPNFQGQQFNGQAMPNQPGQQFNGQAMSNQPGQQFNGQAMPNQPGQQFNGQAMPNQPSQQFGAQANQPQNNNQNFGGFNNQQ